MLSGRANLKLVIWSYHKDTLESELNYPPTDYRTMYLEFIEKEIHKMCNQNKAIDLFKDYDRNHDFYESVMKTMNFYIKYKVHRMRAKLIIDRINLILSFGLIKGISRVICRLRCIDMTKQLFVLELEQGQEVTIPKALS